jgi:hypothetical protein
MNTLTAERACELVEAVAARMPFPAQAADLAGDWTPLQIDLGAFLNPGGTHVAAVEHDRAGIDDARTAEEYDGDGQEPVWWFETWVDGTPRATFSTLGPDVAPADVAAWIAEQARAAGSPAAGGRCECGHATARHHGALGVVGCMSISGQPDCPCTKVRVATTTAAKPARRNLTMRDFVRKIAEANLARLDQAERALRASFEHGMAKGNGHEVWETSANMPYSADGFRAASRAFSVRTRTRTPDGYPLVSPSQATVSAHEDPHRTVLTVKFYTPRVGANSAPYIRTRHYKTGDGAARAIEKHLAHLVETGMHTELGRPLRKVSSHRVDGGTVTGWAER